MTGIDSTEMQNYSAILPLLRNSKRAHIRSHRIIASDIWRSIWEWIWNICVNRISVSLHFPTRRDRDIVPWRNIKIFVVETWWSHTDVFNKFEFPCSVQGFYSCSLTVARECIINIMIRIRCCMCRLTIDTIDSIIKPRTFCEIVGENVAPR